MTMNATLSEIYCKRLKLSDFFHLAKKFRQNWAYAVWKPHVQHIIEEKMPYIPSPRETLDSQKKLTILALIKGGCSRRGAARFVGCAPCTIARAAMRDPDFRAAMAEAQEAANIKLIRLIQSAAKNPRYWRASAWLLERSNPDEFTVYPGFFTKAQVEQVFAEIYELLSQDIPMKNIEQAIQKLQILLYDNRLQLSGAIDFAEVDTVPNLKECDTHAETSAAHTCPMPNGASDIASKQDNLSGSTDSAVDQAATETTHCLGSAFHLSDSDLQPTAPQGLTTTENNSNTNGFA
jgi:hypothetical protein